MFEKRTKRTTWLFRGTCVTAIATALSLVNDYRNDTADNIVSDMSLIHEKMDEINDKANIASSLIDNAKGGEL